MPGRLLWLLLVVMSMVCSISEWLLLCLLNINMGTCHSPNDIHDGYFDAPPPPTTHNLTTNGPCLGDMWGSWYFLTSCNIPKNNKNGFQWKITFIFIVLHKKWGWEFFLSLSVNSVPREYQSKTRVVLMLMHAQTTKRELRAFLLTGIFIIHNWIGN